MIEINLVPQNLAKRRKRSENSLGQGFNMPKELIIGLVGGFFAILIIISVLLQISIFLRLAHLKSLRQQWQEMASTKANVDHVTSQLRSSQAKIKSMESVINIDAPKWAPKLSLISEVLPRGVWLNRIIVTDQRVVVEGNAMSKGKDEMINVHEFAASLRDKPVFMQHLDNLDVGSIQRRTIKTVDVVDFSITAQLKTAPVPAAAPKKK